MKRKTFLQAIGVAALAGGTYKLSQLDRVAKEFSGTEKCLSSSSDMAAR
jgi:hypothetical protein